MNEEKTGEGKAQALSALVQQLQHRRRGFGAPLPLEGHYAGVIDAGDRYFCLKTDNVGTKVLIASALGKWDTVGIDCVAMNVNDIICLGAQPLALVDYLACERYDALLAREIGKGLNAGAVKANVTVIGGEYALVPDLLRHFDLSGSCIGSVPKDRLITGKEIAPGDLLVGLRSSGVHSSGFTLIRKLLHAQKVGLQETPSGLNRTLGEELLEPTEIYVTNVLELLEDLKITGLAHITGGGLRNMVRLNAKVHFRISSPLKPQPIFPYLQGLGELSDATMFETLNMGLGFVLVGPPEDAEIARNQLRPHLEAEVIGEVTSGSGVSVPEHGIRFESY